MSSGPVQLRPAAAPQGGAGVFAGFHGEPEPCRLMSGRYMITRKLTSGGMSDVFEGVDSENASKVALKLVAPNNVELDLANHCMAREALALGRVSHSNVVSLLERGEFLGRQYLALELIEGFRMEDMVGYRPFAWGEARRILGRLCDALSAVHSGGMVHGDLTARNVYLSFRGPVLMDFGFVKFADPALDAGRNPDPNTFLGTPLYVAPEQAMGGTCNDFDHRADIYSLGVLTHLMLSGEFPIEGTPANFCDKLLRERPMPLSAFLPGIDLSVERLVLKALEKDPQRRFQSAEEFRSAVDSIH